MISCAYWIAVAVQRAARPERSQASGQRVWAPPGASPALLRSLYYAPVLPGLQRRRSCFVAAVGEHACCARATRSSCPTHPPAQRGGAGRSQRRPPAGPLAQAVMGTDGVDGCKTTTNHVMEVQTTLGIEAARKTIM